MKRYTLQVSNHPEAGLRIPTQAATESWETKYDGPIATDAEARDAVDAFAMFYKHARLFKGNNIGRLHYAVLRTR